MLNNPVKFIFRNYSNSLNSNALLIMYCLYTIYIDHSAKSQYIICVLLDTWPLTSWCRPAGALCATYRWGEGRVQRKESTRQDFRVMNICWMNRERRGGRGGRREGGGKEGEGARGWERERKGERERGGKEGDGARGWERERKGGREGEKRERQREGKKEGQRRSKRGVGEEEGRKRE